MSVVPLSPPCSKSSPGPWAQTLGLQTAELWNCSTLVLQTSFLHRSVGALTLFLQSEITHFILPFRCSVPCAYVVKSKHEGFECIFTAELFCGIRIPSLWVQTEPNFSQALTSTVLLTFDITFIVSLYRMCPLLRLWNEWRISLIVFETSVGSHLFKTLVTVDYSCFKPRSALC